MATYPEDWHDLDDPEYVDWAETSEKPTGTRRKPDAPEGLDYERMV